MSAETNVRAECAPRHQMPPTALGILQSARAAIGERARTRDVGEERSMARAVAIFNAISGKAEPLDETEGWLFMVALKLARSRQGKFHADDYIDAAAYCALAGECAGKASIIKDDNEKPTTSPLRFFCAAP